MTTLHLSPNDITSRYTTTTRIMLPTHTDMDLMKSIKLFQGNISLCEYGTTGSRPRPDDLFPISPPSTLKFHTPLLFSVAAALFLCLKRNWIWIRGFQTQYGWTCLFFLVDPEAMRNVFMQSFLN